MIVDYPTQTRFGCRTRPKSRPSEPSRSEIDCPQSRSRVWLTVRAFEGSGWHGVVEARRWEGVVV